MNAVELFLSHAVQLELEAATHYESLSSMMHQEGYAEVANFFSTMAAYSHCHLQEAMQRGGFDRIPELDKNSFRWPGGVSPEAAQLDGDTRLDIQGALLIALEGEHRCHKFYQQISQYSPDPEVQRLAAEFAAEEAEHVAELQQWLSRPQRTQQQAQLS